MALILIGVDGGGCFVFLGFFVLFVFLGFFRLLGGGGGGGGCGGCFGLLRFLRFGGSAGSAGSGAPTIRTTLVRRWTPSTQLSFKGATLEACTGLSNANAKLIEQLHG